MNEQFIEIPRSAFASLIGHLTGSFLRDDDPGLYGAREDLVRELLAFVHRRPRPNWASYATLISQLSGAFPGPDDPGPFGPNEDGVRAVLAVLLAERAGNPVPWRPSTTVRLSAAVVELLRRLSGPQPEPWMSTAAPRPEPWRLAAALSVAQEVADKVILVHELAKTLPEQERANATGFAAGQLSQFVQDVDGGLCPIWWWLLFPWPRPPRSDLTDAITPAEVIVMGAQFENAASTVSEPALRESLAVAGRELMNLGLRRLEAYAPTVAVAEA